MGCSGSLELMQLLFRWSRSSKIYTVKKAMDHKIGITIVCTEAGDPEKIANQCHLYLPGDAKR